MPWADALYASDGPWWRQENGAPGFRGLKFTRDSTVLKRFPDLLFVEARQKAKGFVLDGPGIWWGGNSGIQALNLLMKAGIRRIAMVGFDMRVDRGVHWHGRHRGLNNPDRDSVRKWRDRLDGQAERLRAAGYDLVNCSAVSALTAYPKMTLAAALERFGLAEECVACLAS